MTAQIFKPSRISLIHKTYGLHGNQFAIGGICFFALGQDNQLLIENDQWPRVTRHLGQRLLLDMGYAKPRGEVLIAGSAFAPQKKPVTKMTVGVKIGSVDKALKVIGDRQWNGLLFSPASLPKPFLSMPLNYTNSYGGPEHELNPLGKGVIDKAQKDPDTRLYHLPNIYRKWQSTFADGAKKSVAGFEPLDIMWPQRTKYHGTYDKAWLDTVHPGFPNDTNPLLFNAAPDDQQIKGFFNPTDSYQIEGMHPELPIIEGQLPPVKIRAFVSQQSSDKSTDDTNFIEVPTQIDTVWFIPELMLGIAIHRGVIAANDSDGLDIKQLLLAYEGYQDKPREIDYYQELINIRTDFNQAPAHLLNDSQFMPIKTTEQLERRERLYRKAKEKQQQKRARIHKLYTEQLQQKYPEFDLSTIPETDANEPSPIPQELIDEGDVDLSPFMDFAEQKKAEAKTNMDKQLEQAKKEQEKYAVMSEKVGKKTPESIENMKARFKQVVHVIAEDLITASDDKTSYRPDWMITLPVSKEDDTKLTQAALMLAQSKRQARQLAPSVTVLTKPLPQDGAKLLRKWAAQVLEQGLSLAGRDLAGADLSGQDFTGLDLRDIMLEQANLTDCNFTNCQLDGAALTGANLTNTNFTGASLYKANLAQCTGIKTCFAKANLQQTLLVEAKLTHCDFAKATIDKIQGAEIDFEWANFSNAHITGCNFVNAKFNQSIWQQANIDGCTYLECHLQDSDWQRATINRCVMLKTKAKGANFCGVHGTRLQLSNEGDFQQADFSAGIWHTCGFRQVDLRHIDARAAVFRGCDFGQSQMQGALLNDVLFDECVMTQAVLDHSICRETFFNQTSLRKALLNQVDLRDGEFNNCDRTEIVMEHCQTKGMVEKPMPSIN